MAKTPGAWWNTLTPSETSSVGCRTEQNGRTGYHYQPPAGSAITEEVKVARDTDNEGEPQHDFMLTSSL